MKHGESTVAHVVFLTTGMRICTLTKNIILFNFGERVKICDAAEQPREKHQALFWHRLHCAVYWWAGGGEI